MFVVLWLATAVCLGGDGDGSGISVISQFHQWLVAVVAGGGGG